MLLLTYYQYGLALSFASSLVSFPSNSVAAPTKMVNIQAIRQCNHRKSLMSATFSIVHSIICRPIRHYCTSASVQNYIRDACMIGSFGLYVAQRVFSVQVTNGRIKFHQFKTNRSHGITFSCLILSFCVLCAIIFGQGKNQEIKLKYEMTYCTSSSKNILKLLLLLLFLVWLRRLIRFYCNWFMLCVSANVHALSLFSLLLLSILVECLNSNIWFVIFQYLSLRNDQFSCVVEIKTVLWEK